MIDTILPLSVLAMLIFAAGMYVGSKRPVRREQRKLIEARSELAYVRSELSAVSPLRVQAAELAREQSCLDSLTKRQNDVQRQIDKLVIENGEMQYRLEHQRLSTDDRVSLKYMIGQNEHIITRLRVQNTSLTARIAALTLQVKQNAAALQADKEATMVALGLGHFEEVNA